MQVMVSFVLFSVCAVLYAPDIHGRGLDTAKKYTREKAFSRTNPGKGLNDPILWYPECAGYAVCHIEEGMCGYMSNCNVHVGVNINTLCIQI